MMFRQLDYFRLVVRSLCLTSSVTLRIAFGFTNVDAQPFAYVTNYNSHDVSVIDTSTNTEVLPRIPVGTSPVGVAIAPDGAFAYVTNSDINFHNVSVIDTSTNTEVLPRIPVGTSPAHVAITPVTPAATSTSLASSLNPSNFGQIVTFTATVTSAAAGTPTGTVTFKDGATSLGTVTLNASGQASLGTAALSVGTHTITAVYAGSLNYATEHLHGLNTDGESSTDYHDPRFVG
jgi:YVTN family beta-propeller protein